MNREIKKTLAYIEKKGFEAYIVGGFVRDKLIGKNTYDVDICTNALPKDLHSIFPVHTQNNYGGFNIKVNKFNIDITTYRKELRYEGRKPVEIKYINNLLEDLKRRDFTINTICMNTNGKIIDLLDAKKDIKKRVIKNVGDENNKLVEDPLRILRAIRFATVLNFSIDENLRSAIKNKAYLVKTLSSERIRGELNKILLSSNFEYGLMLLKELGIAKELEISYDEVKDTSDLLVMYAQIKLSDNLFTKKEKETIINIKSILNYKKIDQYMLYKYGLYLCSVCGEVLDTPKKDINKIFNNMQINELKSLDISSKEIISILSLNMGKEIKEIKEDIINNILENKLKNKKEDIIKYLINRKSTYEKG